MGKIIIFTALVGWLINTSAQEIKNTSQSISISQLANTLEIESRKLLELISNNKSNELLDSSITWYFNGTDS